MTGSSVKTGAPMNRRSTLFRAVLTAVVLAVPLIGPGAHAAELWSEYQSQAGGFSVIFPGTPKMTAEAGTATSVPSHEFLVQLGPVVYAVSYEDFAPGTLAAQSTERVLDTARNRLVKGQPVKLLADRTVHAGKESGREVVFQEEDGYTQVYRIYVIKDRLYQTITGGPAGSDQSADVVRFHQSFRLTGP
jgi:hypothetical protein